MAKRFCNLINGERIKEGSQGTFKNINPADRSDVIGIFPKSGKAEVNAAVRAAKKAFESWRLVPAPKRGEILKRAGDLLVKYKEQLAELETREMGKILDETRGDVQEGIDTAYYMAGEGRRMFGDTVPCELPNKSGFSIRQPVGVCGMITPWNFPLAIPTWKVFPALVCGNTVVIKPATDTPATVVRFGEILEEAGLPAGCYNVVCGSGGQVGVPLCEHPDVRAVSFTGSTSVGSQIAEICGRLNKKVSLEMGGKNAQIVMDDADLDLALQGALWGAFGTSGQRCTATSRLILHKKIAAKFTRMLVRAAKSLRVGNGLNPKTQMGPVINKTAQADILEYIRIGQEEDGADLILGGKPLRRGRYARGSFIEPTIFNNVTPKMRIFWEEIFGPVLSVSVVSSFDQAIKYINQSHFGLSSSIYTKDVNRAFQAIRDIEAGITYINGPTIGAEIQLPFGGVKGTGNGHRESSHTVLDMFSEWKSVYVDFSGKLQRAQIDTE
ncbi:aldehyde dehydrogenase family protein [Candidatus Sumerlaeota bacterium]|nr:aldehyde dehydrogenase family protein [Candidatus Sumerlaeota bacterium]